MIWGHEHECKPTMDSPDNFSILQPGSTVATSLSEPEAQPKHCFRLEINGEDFRTVQMPLRTARPFKFDTVRSLRLERERATPSERCRCHCAQHGRSSLTQCALGLDSLRLREGCWDCSFALVKCHRSTCAVLTIFGEQIPLWEQVQLSCVNTSQI